MDMLQSPLLGNKTTEQLAADTLTALADEATTAECYQRLMDLAPDAAQCAQIRGIYQNKLTHYGYFERLYRALAHRRPKFTVTPVTICSYNEGLHKALERELKAAATYRDVQLSTTLPIVREVYYLPMVNALTHATRFSALICRQHYF